MIRLHRFLPISIAAVLSTISYPTPMPMLPAYPDTLHVLVLDSISHDTSSFTQGLEMHNSLLYESTGRYGHSAIRILDPETGNLIDSANLPYFIFAEGITFLNETLYQLTWKAGIVFVFDETIHEQPMFTVSIQTDGASVQWTVSW